MFEDTFEMPWWFNAHTHSRGHVPQTKPKACALKLTGEAETKMCLQQALFQKVVRLHAEGFWGGIHMPNLFDPYNGEADPIITPWQVYRYRRAITGALPAGSSYRPYPAIQLYDWTTTPMLKEAKALDSLVAKAYMAGVTYSGYALTNLFSNRTLDNLKTMAQIGMPLSLHLGMPSDDLFKETRLGLDMLKELVRVTASFGPKGLKIILEHVPDWETLEALLALPDRVGGTFTVHHLTTDAERFWSNGHLIDPFFLCKPVLGFEDDRAAMIEALRRPRTRRRLWLGLDDAPHPKSAKLAKQSPGIWMPSRVAISLLIELFEANGLSLEALNEFACFNGPTFYGIKVPVRRMTLQREPFMVPDHFWVGDTGEQLIPLHAGQMCQWQLAA